MPRPILVLCLLLLATPAPFAQHFGEPPPAAAVRITPPRPLAPPSSMPAPFVRSRPSVAGSGNQYLAAWWDSRAERNGLALFAARIGPDGSVLDPHGIIVGAVTSWFGSTSHPPKVFAFPDHYLVIWETQGKTVASRIMLDGTLVDAAPRIIAPGPLLATAGNGDEVLLVVRDRGTIGLIVDREGEIRRKFVLRSTSVERAIAASGKTFLVVTESRNCSGIGCRRTTIEQISRDGEILHHIDDAFPSRSLRDIATDNASGFVVLFTPPDTNALAARLITLDGQIGPEMVIDPEIVFAPGLGSADASIVWNGAHYLVAWSHQVSPYVSELRLTRLDREATSVEAPVTIATDAFISIYTRSVYSPALAWDRGRLLMVWRSQPHPSTHFSDLRVGLFSETGFPLSEETRLSSSSLAQERPNLTSNGIIHVITWVDYLPAEGQARLKAARILDDGTILDTTASTSTRRKAGAGQLSPLPPPTATLF